MKPWQPGDPVGMGEIYLPDAKSSAAYANACRVALIDSAARHVIGLQSLHQRRAYIDKQPKAAQEALKARIRELWETRQ